MDLWVDAHVNVALHDPQSITTLDRNSQLIQSTSCPLVLPVDKSHQLSQNPELKLKS